MKFTSSSGKDEMRGLIFFLHCVVVYSMKDPIRLLEKVSYFKIYKLLEGMVLGVEDDAKSIESQGRRRWKEQDMHLVGLVILIVNLFIIRT